jgi:uncharacterized membrane protein
MIETEVGLSVERAKEAGVEGRFGKRMAVAFICAALSAIAVAPFFFMGRAVNRKTPVPVQIPITHDLDLHFEQMKSFHNGISSGELYPRWEEGTNRHFGAPTTSYYPPGVYYLTSASYAIFSDWWSALLVTHLVMMIASGATIYLYARQAMSRAASIVAMAAYIFTPYHLIDQYQRGAMAEMLGFIWMPLMLFFAERLLRPQPEWSARPASGLSHWLASVAGLALTYGAFLWSHPPTAYQFSLAFGLFVFLLALARKNLKGLFAVGCALALGLGLSAAYLYPAAVEQDLIRHEYVSETWPYHATYVFLHALPYAGSPRGFFNLLDGVWLFSTSIIVAGAISMLVSMLVQRAFKLRPVGLTAGLNERIGLWIVMGCFAAFMMTEASAPVGRLIPKIDIGVFTWRMLSISSLVWCLLAGACAQAVIEASRKRLRSGLIAFGFVAALITVGGLIFSILAVAGPVSRARFMVPMSEHLNYAMVPRTAPEDPRELPQVAAAELARGKGRVSIDVWDSEHRQLRVELDEEDLLFIRTFNFPGWTATVNGQPAAIKTGEDLGDIVLELSAGAHHIRLDYLDTPPRRTGGYASLISLLAVMSALCAAFAARARKELRIH